MRKYHVAFSFAGEDREYVEKVLSYLKKNSTLRVFYDKDNETHLWGKNLLEVFQDIYTREAHFVVMFVSANYVRKVFPKQERRYAMDRALESEEEYILLAKFDDTEIPGISPSTSYIDLRECLPEEFAQKIIKKMTKKGLYFGEPISQEFYSVKKTSSNLSSQSIFTTINGNSSPLPDVDVRTFHPNGTSRAKKSDAEGQTTFSNIKQGDFYSIFCAHPNYPAAIIDNHEAGFNLTIQMKPNNGIGSAIFNSTGYLPGLEGRLNPILDNFGRTYLYADNIAINGSTERQPRDFKYGKNVRLEDCNGRVANIRFLRIIGRYALLDYIVHR